MRTLCRPWLAVLAASVLVTACRDQRDVSQLGDDEDLELLPARVSIVSPDTAGRDVEPGQRVVTGQVAVTGDGRVVLEEVDRDHDGQPDYREPDSPPTEDPPPPPEVPVEPTDPPLTPYPR